MLVSLPDGVLGTIARQLSSEDLASLRSLHTEVCRAVSPQPPDVHSLACSVAERSVEWWDNVRRGVEGQLRAGNLRREVVDCLSVCSLRDMGLTVQDVRQGFAPHEWGAISMSLVSMGMSAGEGCGAEQRRLRGLSLQDIDRLVACAW